MNLITRAYNSLTKRSIDLSGANSLFGSIGASALGLGTNYDFIPTDGQGGILDLKDETTASANWLGLSSKSMQYWAYIYCSPLAGVIDRLAEADSNGVVEFINEDGTTIKNVNKNPRLLRIKKLDNNPNPIQTRYEFNAEQKVLCKIFGYCPVLYLVPDGMDKSYSKFKFNLNPYYWNPSYNYQYDMYETEDESKMTLIKDWSATILGRSYRIPSKDILLIKDGFVNQNNSMGLPLSKIAGLDYFVSNICAAMEADNVLLKKKGPLGVFSYDAKPDMAGTVPMTPAKKDEVQQELKKYGLTWNQLQYVVSRIPIKWNPMSFNVQELDTKNTVRQGIEGICDRFGYPAELMSGKNATYENRNSAEKFLYQNNVIPFSLRVDECENNFFGLTDGIRKTTDFDHLPVLQENIVQAGTARYQLSQALTLDWQNGVITFNQYRDNLEMDTVAGMDIFYNEYMKKFPPPPIPVQKPTKTKTDATKPKNQGA